MTIIGWNDSDLAEEVVIPLRCQLVARKVAMVLTQVMSVFLQLSR